MRSRGVVQPEEARAPNRLDKSRVRLCPVQLSGRSQSSVQRKCEYHLLTHLCLMIIIESLYRHTYKYFLCLYTFKIIFQ